MDYYIAVQREAAELAEMSASTLSVTLITPSGSAETNIVITYPAEHPTSEQHGRIIPTVIISRPPSTCYNYASTKQNNYRNLRTIPSYQSIMLNTDNTVLSKTRSSGVNGEAAVSYNVEPWSTLPPILAMVSHYWQAHNAWILVSGKMLWYHRQLILIWSRCAERHLRTPGQYKLHASYPAWLLPTCDQSLHTNTNNCGRQLKEMTWSSS